MRKMNKALAAVLAASMVMSMNMTAWAVEESENQTGWVEVIPNDPNAGKDDNFTDEKTVVIKKTYEVNHVDAISPAEEFEFTISNGAVLAEDTDTVYVTDSTLKNESASCKKAEITNVSFEKGEAGSDAKTKAITVTLPDYDQVGIYYYTINEAAGNTAGVTYHEESIILKVTVVQQGADHVRVAAVHAEKPYNTTGASKKSDGITNTYSAGKLSVLKRVTGNMGDQTKDFTVTVKFTAPEGTAVKGDITYTDGDEEKIISNWVSASPAADYAIAEIALKHGETVTFNNIPYGVTYTVVEDDYTGENGGYDAPVYTFYDEDKEINSLEDRVEIVNNKGVTVDTGIALDSIPYIMILGAAVAGMAVVASKKKEEDLF